MKTLKIMTVVAMLGAFFAAVTMVSSASRAATEEQFDAAAAYKIERRKRKWSPDSQIAAYPRIDLNDPRQRRIAFSLVAVSFVFVFMSAFGSYRAYEYSESVEFCGKTCHSVMKPEHVAFMATSHANSLR